MVVLDSTIVKSRCPRRSGRWGSPPIAVSGSSPHTHWHSAASCCWGESSGTCSGASGPSSPGLSASRVPPRSEGWRNPSGCSSAHGHCRVRSVLCSPLGAVAADGDVCRLARSGEGVRHLRRDRRRRRVGRPDPRRGADTNTVVEVVSVRQRVDRVTDSVVALRLLQNHPPEERPRIDVPGVLLACGGLFALVYGFSNAETHSWTTPLTIVSLATSVVLLVAFVAVERRRTIPSSRYTSCGTEPVAAPTCRSCWRAPGCSRCSSS